VDRSRIAQGFCAPTPHQETIRDAVLAERFTFQCALFLEKLSPTSGFRTVLSVWSGLGPMADTKQLRPPARL